MYRSDGEIFMSWISEPVAPTIRGINFMRGATEGSSKKTSEVDNPDEIDIDMDDDDVNDSGDDQEEDKGTDWRLTKLFSYV